MMSTGPAAWEGVMGVEEVSWSEGPMAIESRRDIVGGCVEFDGDEYSATPADCPNLELVSADSFIVVDKVGSAICSAAAPSSDTPVCFGVLVSISLISRGCEDDCKRVIVFKEESCVVGNDATSAGAAVGIVIGRFEMDGGYVEMLMLGTF